MGNQVTRDGLVQEPPLAQLTYGALLQGRTAMVADAANVSKKALVIALRYAAVRRQFKVGHKEVRLSPSTVSATTHPPTLAVRIPSARLPDPPAPSAPAACAGGRNGLHLAPADEAV